MKRLAFIALAATVLAGCQETTQPDAHTVPLFLSTASQQANLLATTGEGELVVIDLDAGTATLIGDAGVFDGREPGWTGLSFDKNSNLFVTSNRRSEAADPSDPCFAAFGQLVACSHLYVIDPGTGAVLAEIGSTGGRFISDIDFAKEGTLYGSKFLDDGSGRGQGALITLDPTTAGFTPIGRFGPGVGFFDLENGGLSVHPQTGELWGVESSFSRAAAIFKIDPVSGAASDIVRLGLNGLPTDFGLDAFEILPDGRFVGARGFFAFGISELYLIDPTPDATSGLAELTLIPLTFDPSITTKLNGLESSCPTGGDPFGDCGGDKKPKKPKKPKE